jgi:uroporphyrinogen III methyltransferase/synthase
MSSTQTGAVTFVSAGPGDPGLLTRRALDALGRTEQIFYDASTPQDLLAAVTEAAPEGVSATAMEGGSADIAQTVVTAARSGSRVARVVHGDALSLPQVVAEVRAVAAADVPFEVLPGVTHVDGVASYAGTPLGAVRTLVDAGGVSAVDFAAVASAPGTLAITLDAVDLPTVQAGLLGAEMPDSTPLTITGEATTEIQSTSVSTLKGVADAAVGLVGRLVLTLGEGVSERESLGWWESRPLYGWKVLVPRTKEQAGAMSARLRVWGAIPCEVPTIAVEPPRTPAQMERAVKGLVDGRYAWVVFTSANAVKAIWEKFSEHGLDARDFGGVKIACIGDATAEAVRNIGITPQLLPADEQSSLGLLEGFPPYDKTLDPIDRVLLPRADIATETLAAGLAERGWEIDDVTAYRTVRASPPAAEIRDAIKSGGFDAVLFTSSSTVRNLVGIAGKPHARTVIACIGPKTAETATEVGLRVDVQPETANVQSLVEATAQYAAELREKMIAAPVKPRRGAKIQGPTAGRLGIR